MSDSVLCLKVPLAPSYVSAPSRDDAEGAASEGVEPMYEVDCGNMFPLPTVFDALLSLIGSGGPIHLEAPRPIAEIVAALEFIRNILRDALLNEDEGIEIDLSDPQVPLCSRVLGVVDFIVASGFQRRGVTLRFSNHSSKARRLCYLALDEVTDELQQLESTGRGRKSVPVLSRVGEMLTKFDLLQKQTDEDVTAAFRFDTLLEWIKLRNYFYMAYTVVSDDDEQALQHESWADYFETSRLYAHEVANKVEWFHRNFASEMSLDALTRDGLMASRLLSLEPTTTDGQPPRTPLQPPARPPTNRKHPATPSDVSVDGASFPVTPSDKLSAASPYSIVSPGDCLTRTPQHRLDRELFCMQQPPTLEDCWRDPAGRRCGLYNIRQSCFVNALIQVLSSMDSFTESLMCFPTSKWLQSKGVALSPAMKVTHRLQSLFAYLKLSQSSAVNPGPLLDAVGSYDETFGDGQQHDPHEFALSLLDAASKSFAQVEEWAAAQQQHPDSSDDKADEASSSESRSAAISSVKERARRSTLQFQHHIRASETITFVSNGVTEGEQRTSRGWLQSLLPIYFPDSSNIVAVPLLSQDSEKKQSSHVDPMALLDDGPRPPNSVSHAAVTPQDHLLLYKSLTDFFVTHIEPTLDEQQDQSVGGTTGEKSSRLIGMIKVLNSLPTALVLCLASRTSSVHLTGERNERVVSFPEKFRLPFLSNDERTASALEQVLKCKEDLFAVTQGIDELSVFLDAARALQGTRLWNKGAAHGVSTEISKLESELCVLRLRKEDLTKENDSFVRRLFHQEETTAPAAWEYDLCGVIVHEGAAATSGHYVSYSKSPADGAWWLCSDTQVQRVEASDVFSLKVYSKVYCLVYQRSATQRAPPVIASVMDDLELRDGVPLHLHRLVEKEDSRRQLLLAQRLSEEY